MPPSITKIVDSAFLGCVSLTNINLENVTSIGANAFYGCENVKELTLGKRIKIGHNAFLECDKLQKLTVYDRSAYLDNTGLTEINRLFVYGYTGPMPAFFALYNDIPFYDIETNELMTREFRVQPEEGVLLKYSGRDNTVEIPAEVDSVTVLALGDAFAGKDITYIELPDSVEVIYHYAFAGCNALDRVILSSAMTRLTNIFEGCAGLRKIYIPAGIVNIENDIFRDCPNVTIYGEKGSAAEIYANKNNITFIEGEIPDGPSVVPLDGYIFPYRVVSYSVSGVLTTITAECYERAENICMIYASFNNEGELIGVEARKVCANSGERFDETFTNIGRQIKVFIWDQHNQKPYSSVYSIMRPNKSEYN